MIISTSILCDIFLQEGYIRTHRGCVLCVAMLLIEDIQWFDVENGIQLTSETGFLIFSIVAWVKNNAFFFISYCRGNSN